MRWLQRLRAVGRDGDRCWSSFCLSLHPHPHDQVWDQSDGDVGGGVIEVDDAIHAMALVWK